VTADGSLDLSGGVTIDNGTLGNAGGYINVTGSDTIENEAGQRRRARRQHLHQYRDADGRRHRRWRHHHGRAPGTLTLSNDWVEQLRPTTYGIIG